MQTRTAGENPPTTARAVQPRRRGGILRRLAAVLLTVMAIVLIIWTLLTQLLAVVPVAWTTPLLADLNVQVVLLLAAWTRDSLGVWNILVALLGLLAAFGAWRLARTRKPRQRFKKGLTAAGAAAVALTVAVWSVIVGSIAASGGGFHPFAPALPVAADFGDPDRTVTVGAPDGQKLTADLYLPRGTSGSAAIPVVVNIHGGGFVIGKAMPGPYNRYLAEHGYAVLDVNYRLASATDHTWHTAVGDVGCALTWLTTHSTQIGIDTSRVAINGGSAGGALALNAAYRANAHTLTPTCGTEAEIPHIKTVIGGYPAGDVIQSQQDSAVGELVGQYYAGGTPTQHPDRYAYIEAKNAATAAAPPTLIYQGGSDHLILASTTRGLVADLRHRGVTVEYRQFFGLDHGIGGTQNVLAIGDTGGRVLTLDWLHAHLR